MKGNGNNFGAMFDTLGTDRADRSHEQQAAARAVLLRVDQGRLTADEARNVLGALGLLPAEEDTGPSRANIARSNRRRAALRARQTKTEQESA